MQRLDGKVALITGAAQGVGAATARLFLEQGASVMITDLGDSVSAVQPGTAPAAGPDARAAYRRLDVRDEASWNDAVAATLARFGRLDILINNAGILRWQAIEAMSLDDYMATIHVNQVGCWLGMRAVLPAMRAGGGGAIVNTASLAGRAGMANGSAYVASKHAILGMTRSAALEFGIHHIRVNAVAPGGIDTAMNTRAQVIAAGKPDPYAHLPVARPGTAMEVARAMLYLASDEASYCTGTELIVDGGMSAGARLG